MKIKKSILKNLIYPLVSLAAFFLLWQIAAAVVDFKLILPPPADVFGQLLVVVRGSFFWRAVWGTLARSLKGFVFSAVAATVLALASAKFSLLHRMLSPIITLIRSVPTMSIILLVLVWLSSANSPVLVAAMIVFPMMYSNFYFAFNNVDRDILQMSKVYKVNNVTVFKDFYLPSVAPSFLETLKSSISLNLKVVIASEVLAQTKFSMGMLMQNAQIYMNTAELLAWTIVAVLLSFALEGAVAVVKLAVIRWER